MPFDSLGEQRCRIAVIGGGISGLAAARLLSDNNDVVLYEARTRLGGHARTAIAGRHGDQAVDTGFIVFNYANYPHLTSLFRELGVPVERSDMSFGVSIGNGKLEYGLRSPAALFAQKRNLADPRFFGMVRDILRFNSRGEDAARDSGATIDELVDGLDLGSWFRRYYLRPICGAIWSTGTGKIGEFPAEALMRFLRNHALLGVSGQHQWWTVSGGSLTYVKLLSEALKARNVKFMTGSAITKVIRRNDGIRVVSKDGFANYDQAVLACHADQALKLLDRPTAAERSALSSIGFQSNDAVLHCDPELMPCRRACWSAWVYQADSRAGSGKIGVTYWMNRLQNIPETDPLFVTLNPVRQIREDLIYDRTVFRHPIFNGAALAAQQRIFRMQGQNRTWFAGAWLRNGFHEDGIASAHRIARAFDRRPSIAEATK